MHLAVIWVLPSERDLIEKMETLNWLAPSEHSLGTDILENRRSTCDALDLETVGRDDFGSH